MPRALIQLARGCEELDAGTVIALLCRSRIDGVVAGLLTGTVTASRDTRISEPRP